MVGVTTVSVVGGVVVGVVVEVAVVSPGAFGTVVDNTIGDTGGGVLTVVARTTATAPRPSTAAATNSTI